MNNSVKPHIQPASLLCVCVCVCMWLALAQEGKKQTRREAMESRRAAIIESAKAIGIDELKREQYLAIDSILRGKDTFVSLPTGYGKSVVFAALPLAFDKVKGL